MKFLLILFTFFVLPLNAQSKKALKHFKRGQKAVSEYKYIQAIVDFTKAISYDKEFVDAYEQRGFSFLQVNRLEASAQDYERVTALDPKRISSMAQLIAIYQYLKRPEQAMKVIDKMEEFHPYADATILYERAECYELMGEDAEALKLYEEALGIFNDKGKEYEGLASECEKRIINLNKD